MPESFSSANQTQAHTPSYGPGRRRACRLLVPALLIALATSAPAAPPSKKPKPKPASFGQLAAFYAVTPSGYNDDITETDAMVMSYPGYKTAMTSVPAETQP